MKSKSVSKSMKPHCYCDADQIVAAYYSTWERKPNRALRQKSTLRAPKFPNATLSEFQDILVNFDWKRANKQDLLLCYKLGWILAKFSHLSLHFGSFK